MLPLTLHLLVKNHEQVIERAISSLQSIQGEILIGDLGSTDRTLEICKDFQAKIFHKKEHRGNLRNQMIAGSGYDWQLMLEPSEVLVSPELIESLLTHPTAYAVSVLQGDMIIKDIRLWHKGINAKYVHPVCEYLNVAEDKAQSCQITIFSNGDAEDYYEQLKKWRQESPTALEPMYYEACYFLSHQQWDSFLSSSQKYLFTGNNGMRPTMMLKYYQAIVKCHIKKNAQEAIQDILGCIAVKPLMAEYWCVLADIYYFLVQDYAKAKQFYQNAMILGSRRLSDDRWPLEISKYKKYPQKMIASCDKILEKSFYVRLS